MFNNIEQLKTLTNRTTKIIELKDIGRFKIRALSAAESIKVMKRDEDIHIKTVMYGLINDSGERIFDDSSLETLRELPATVVVQISTSIMGMSELADIKDVEEK